MEIINATEIHFFGAVFCGTLLTALFFGVLTIQTSSYYHAFPNDGWLLKLAVALLWALGAFQLACCTKALYWWFVTSYGNPLVLEWGVWEFASYPIDVALSSLIVQTFFAYRVYSLSANLYVGALVQVLVLLQFGFSAANGIRTMRILALQGIVKECTWLIVAWLAIQAIADIVIAACMCLLLRRRRTGFQKTDSVINRMVLHTISTGFVTSVLSCIVLALFFKSKFGIGVLVIAMPLGEFYSITMLTNLHMRTRLRARLNTPSPLELIAYSVKKRMRQKAGDHGNARHNAYIDEERSQATQININREVACNDVDINLMNHDTKVQFTAIQSPVSGGT